MLTTETKQLDFFVVVIVLALDVSSVMAEQSKCWVVGTHTVEVVAQQLNQITGCKPLYLETN